MQKYMGMVSLSPPASPDVTFTKAKHCSINQGCLDEQGDQKSITGNMYVDDGALTAHYHMMSHLYQATIMATFAIYSIPDEQFHQCTFSLSKWMGQLVTFHFTFLGLLYDTGKMPVAIMDDYLQ
jgi:hypothetical protein